VRPPLDETHDAALQSWVESANGHCDFPIQNLPFGVFQPTPSEPPRGGVAIGDLVLDLASASASGLLSGDVQAAAALAGDATLNAFLSLPGGVRRALRRRLSALLAKDAPERDLTAAWLRPAETCAMRLPARIGDYTDFYAGIHHAETVGRIFRPDNPLLPNYKHVPIAYHGRASSVRVSGEPVRRPRGQVLPPNAAAPEFLPSARLDIELELGIWIGPGNPLGEPLPIADAEAAIAGFCLLNDWSARDIQTWEYQPLGPFLAKNFMTSVSPWIVTAEALAPFRVAQPRRPAGDPKPLPHLLSDDDQANGAYAVELEAWLQTSAMRAAGLDAQRIASSAATDLYWTPAQMVAHHTSGGCNLEAGDLLGSGTVSAPRIDGGGSLLELTQSGREPLTLPGGERRAFLGDGDVVVLKGRAARDGFVSIGLGECRGEVLPAFG